MSEDIVTRLRYVVYDDVNALLIEAADEIERLRAVIRELQMLIAIEADMAVDEALAKKEARRG